MPAITVGEAAHPAAYQKRSDGVPTPGSEKYLDTLVDEARKRGFVRVLVRLEVGLAFDPGQLAASPQYKSELVSRIEQANDAFRQRFEALDGLDGSVISRTYRFLPTVALRVNESTLLAVAGDPAVRKISRDHRFVDLLDDSISQINADLAWLEGATGSGRSVAILDSGVETSHEFLAGRTVTEGCFSTPDDGLGTFCPGGTTSEVGSGTGQPCGNNFPRCWHGTRVAGVALGASATGGPNINGVAKAANLIAVQASSPFLDPEGRQERSYLESDVIAALDWLRLVYSSYSLAAVNASFGTPPNDERPDGTGTLNTSYCDFKHGDLKDAVDNLRAVGVLTVAATGNDGNKEHAAAPACLSSVVSVAAVDNYDSVTNYSNSHDVTDLMAPGGGDQGATFAERIHTSDWNGGYEADSGTSFSSPHVAGAVAAIRDKFGSNVTADQIVAQLKDTGLNVTYQDDENNTITVARIDLGAAVETPLRPSDITVTNMQCYGQNEVSWTDVNLDGGAGEFYQLEASSSSSFTTSQVVYEGTATTTFIEVTGTTYVRVRACGPNEFCSEWTVASETAEYYNGCA